MSTEDSLVAHAEQLIRRSLAKRCEIKRSACLLYEIKVNNRLEIAIDPKLPVRGQSAFQTDLCVFERVAPNVRLPRVVLEFKPGVSTHDILTYTSKARRHKQIYPYLRYGIVSSREHRITAKFFTHNEALDFMLACGGLSRKEIGDSLTMLVKKELQTSRALEALAFDQHQPRVYRREIVVK